MWQVTPDTWRGMDMISKFQLSSSYGLGVLMFWRSGGKDDSFDQWMNELMTKAFVEQPGLGMFEATKPWDILDDLWGLKHPYSCMRCQKIALIQDNSEPSNTLTPTTPGLFIILIGTVFNSFTKLFSSLQ